MNAPSSSSSIDAVTTTVEAAVVTAAVLMTVALDQKLKNHDDIIIFNNVIGKCHKCLKMNLVYFVIAQFHPMKTMSHVQTPCFDIEY